MLSCRYKHVIWDWNGTLLDDAGVCIDTMNAMLKRRGMNTIDRDYYTSIFDFPVINYYKKLGFDFEKESFKIVADEYINEYEARCPQAQLHYGVDKVLRMLKGQGVTQSILSASHTDSLKKFVEHFEIIDFFINLIGLDNHYAVSKVENGKLWLKEIGIDRENILLVGDTVHDYEVTKELGIDCILVANGHQSIERLRVYDARIINNLEELIDYVSI